MSRECISVIIPSYNHAGTIALALESVFTQTLLPSEVIVVNDGSTDATAEAVKPYLDRIEYIEGINQGGNAARNKGFARSTGDYVIFHDADGIMRPDMLETLFATLESHPEASYAYSRFTHEGRHFKSAPFDPELLKRMNFIHTTSLIRRAHFPGFDPEIKKLQDWDLWLTMLGEDHVGVFVDENLLENLKEPGRAGISKWMPSFMYKIPWEMLGWMPDALRKYREAEKVIQEKHGL